MSKAPVYNYGKYSVLDIQKCIEEKGYQTTFEDPKNRNRLYVLGTKISIDIAHYGKNKEGKEFILFLPSIRFDDGAYNKKTYEEDKKLYLYLLRKFRMGKAGHPAIIKDWDKIKPLVKETKRPMPFWLKFAIVFTALCLLIALPATKIHSISAIPLFFLIACLLGMGIQIIKNKL